MYFLHPLHEPSTDVRIRRDKALVGISIGSLDVNDGERAAIGRLLMPDGWRVIPASFSAASYSSRRAPAISSLVSRSSSSFPRLMGMANTISVIALSFPQNDLVD